MAMRSPARLRPRTRVTWPHGDRASTNTCIRWLTVIAKLVDELGDKLIEVRARVVDMVIELVDVVCAMVIDEVIAFAPRSSIR